MEHKNNCGNLVKLIAVSEKPDKLIAGILQKILEYCGHIVAVAVEKVADKEKCDYLIVPAAEITELPENIIPSVLLLADFTHVSEQILNHANTFTSCVMDYDNSVPPFADYLIDCKIRTYSATSDNADFTARYIHTIDEETAFEIVGVGVIGRAKLRNPDMVKPSLVAAAAAISCGVSFADMLDALNNMKIEE